MRYVAKTKLSQDHAVNALPVVFFYAAIRKKTLFLFIIKFNRMSIFRSVALKIPFLFFLICDKGFMISAL